MKGEFVLQTLGDRARMPPATRLVYYSHGATMPLFHPHPSKCCQLVWWTMVRLETQRQSWMLSQERGGVNGDDDDGMWQVHSLGYPPHCHAP